MQGLAHSSQPLLSTAIRLQLVKFTYILVIFNDSDVNVSDFFKSIFTSFNDTGLNTVKHRVMILKKL